MKIPKHNFTCPKEVILAETIIEFNLSRHNSIQYTKNFSKHYETPPNRINPLPTKPSPKHYLDLKK